MKITTDDIVRTLRNAAWYEARDAELHYRAMLRAEQKRRRSTKGRQRVKARELLTTPADKPAGRRKTDGGRAARLRSESRPALVSA